jgi:hypothetical protein
MEGRLRPAQRCGRRETLRAYDSQCATRALATATPSATPDRIPLNLELRLRRRRVSDGDGHGFFLEEPRSHLRLDALRWQHRGVVRRQDVLMAARFKQRLNWAVCDALLPLRSWADPWFADVLSGLRGCAAVASAAVAYPNGIGWHIRLIVTSVHSIVSWWSGNGDTRPGVVARKVFAGFGRCGLRGWR